MKTQHTPHTLGWALPAGVSDLDLARHCGGDEGEETCETCGGTGEIIVCISPEDGPEREKCPDCSGNGYTEYSISERRAEARENAAEERAEARREEAWV